MELTRIILYKGTVEKRLYNGDLVAENVKKEPKQLIAFRTNTRLGITEVKQYIDKRNYAEKNKSNKPTKDFYKLVQGTRMVEWVS